MSTSPQVPNITESSQAKPPKGEWLRTRMSALYNSDKYKSGNIDAQNHYKRQAYNKWVVPYFKKTFKDIPPMTESQFLDNSQYVKDLQRKEFWNKAFTQDKKNFKKNFYSAVKNVDKSISGVASLLDFVSNLPERVFSRNYVSKEDTPLTYSRDYYARQAQDMEDRIQDMGGHNLATHLSGLVADMAMFEATGAAKGSSLFKLANPKTVSYGTRLLKSQWNGAVTGLFWGGSTGGDIPSDMATFSMFNAAGVTGTKLSQFLRTFTKVAPTQVVKSTVNEAVKGLLSEGVSVPKQTSFNIENVEENKKAATAGVAQALNYVAAEVKRDSTGRFLSLEKRVLNSEDVNGAFKSLLPKQQKIVITRLLSMLSTSQDAVKNDFVNGLADFHLQEQQEKINEAVPKAAQVQQVVDEFIQKNGVPKEEVTKVKLGAVLERHNTNENSPLGHVSARLSWLRSLMDREGTTSADKEVIIKAIDEEKELFKLIKFKSSPTFKEPIKTSSLPNELKQSKPRYGYGTKLFKLSFKSDKDLALYTVAQDKRNKAHDEFMTWLISQFPNKNQEELIQMGKQVKNSIKNMAKNNLKSEEDILEVEKHF